LRGPWLAESLGLLLLTCAIGCGDVAGLQGTPTMDPGQDCLLCHVANGQASDRIWTASGTIYAGSPLAPTAPGLFNAEILILDSANRALTLRSNGAGNFYTAEPLTYPIHVSAQIGGQRFQMQESPPEGVSCNRCHALDATGAPVQPFVPNFQVVPGRLFLPVDAGVAQ